MTGNLYADGFCLGCQKTMKLKDLFAHRLPNGDCPDQRGLFALTHKSKRIIEKRRRH